MEFLTDLSSSPGTQLAKVTLDLNEWCRARGMVSSKFPYWCFNKSFSFLVVWSGRCVLCLDSPSFPSGQQAPIPICFNDTRMVITTSFFVYCHHKASKPLVSPMGLLFEIEMCDLSHLVSQHTPKKLNRIHSTPSATSTAWFHKIEGSLPCGPSNMTWVRPNVRNSINPSRIH